MRTLGYLFFAVTMMALPGIAVAGELIGPAPVADISDDQDAVVKQIESEPTTESVRVVTVDPTVLDPSLGTVTVSLDADAPMVFPTETQDVQGAVERDGTFVWSAFADAGVNLDGAAATVSVSEGEVSATFRTPTEIYRIEPLGGGLSALVKVNPAAFPPEEPVIEQPASDQMDVNDIELRPEGDVSIAKISVLVAATPAAMARIRNLQQFAALAIAVSNDTFRNSGVNVMYELAGIDAIPPGYVQAGSHEKDLARLASTNDGFLDDIHTIRQQTKADMVLLLIDDGSFCGLAKQILASKSTAFVTVHWACAIDNLSFPHELGHLLGACHNTEISAGCSSFPWAHGFLNAAQSLRTIMAYPCPNTTCVRMPQWSRPPQWGDSGKRNNARVLNETAPRAAGFM